MMHLQTNPKGSTRKIAKELDISDIAKGGHFEIENIFS